MILLAKLISLVIIAKGLLMFIFPVFIGKCAGKFYDLESKKKRLLGIVFVLCGLMLVIISRRQLTVPLVHWVIAVCGIMMVLYSTVIVVIPEISSKFVLWFCREKPPVSLIGLLSVFGGIILYMLVLK
ncbi:DUF2065 family protein [Elusimicrobiota bacterium]